METTIAYWCYLGLIDIACSFWFLPDSDTLNPKLTVLKRDLGEWIPIIMLVEFPFLRGNNPEL